MSAQTHSFTEHYMDENETRVLKRIGIAKGNLKSPKDLDLDNECIAKLFDEDKHHIYSSNPSGASSKSSLIYFRSPS